MKKLFLLFFLIPFISCQNKQEGSQEQAFKDIALDYLKKEIDYRMPHSEKDVPEITEIKDYLTHDSAYSCTFSLKAINRFGGWSRGNFTYTFILLPNGKKSVTLIDKDDKLSIEVSKIFVDTTKAYSNYDILKQYSKNSGLGIDNYTREVE